MPVLGTKGASTHVWATVRSLRRRGHDVRVFFSNLRQDADELRDLDEEYDVAGLSGIAGEVQQLLLDDALHLPVGMTNEVRRLLHAEHTQRMLRPVLEDFAPDLIYERYSLANYAGLELARALRLPYALEVNAPLWQEQRTHREMFLTRTAGGLERRIICSADAVVVISEALKSFVLGLGVGEERVTVLPNGADPELFSPATDGDTVRSRLGIDGKRVVGFVGTLKPWHDLTTLARAAEALQASDPLLHLLLVGAGPRMEEMQASVNGRTAFTGAVPHEEVPGYLAVMDVVVVPYEQDGDAYFSPLKLFEAMAMARPIVAARVRQVEDVLVDGKTGLLYEPGNAADLAEKISAVLAMSDRGASLGRAARKVVEAGRTWDANAARIEELAAVLIESNEGHRSWQ
ncbi:MAG: glycosyltransferase family 4 protein [Dehalococcoidia bacterium]